MIAETKHLSEKWVDRILESQSRTEVVGLHGLTKPRLPGMHQY